MTDSNVQDKVFDINNLPDDAQVFTGQGGNFAPIDDSQIYQVEVSKIELRQNPFWHETPENASDEEKAKAGSKYQFNFTLTVLDDGEFRGRKLWVTTSLALKPTTKGGKGEPTILFKLITKVMNAQFSWDDCQSFAPELKTLFVNLNENVLGKQLKVSIENTTNPDTKKTRSKVKTFYNAKGELPRYSPDEQEKIFTDPESGEPVVATPAVEEVTPAEQLPIEEEKKSKKK